MVLEGKNSQSIFKELELEEHTLYQVKVKRTQNNVEHTAYLFAGFSSGGYCMVYSNTYEHPVGMQRCYSIKVSKKLVELKN